MDYDRENQSSVTIPVNLLVALALLVVIVLLWLPFGLKITGTVEEWLRFDRYFEGRWLPSPEINRALVSTPYILAYILTPFSFVGLNVVHILVLWWKGLALFALMRSVTGKVGLAFGAAVIFILYPADTGMISLRVISIDVSLAALLTSMGLLLYLFKKGLRWRTAPLLLVLWGGQLICLMIYEAGYPMMLLTPVLLIWLARRITRQVITLTVLWYLVPLVMGILLITLTLQSDQTYQSGLLSQGLRSPDLFSAIINSMIRAYRYNLVESWIDALDLSQSSVYWLIGLGAGCWVVLIMRQFSAVSVAQRQNVFFALGFGLVLIGAGFAIYALTPLRNQVFRVFLYAAVGSGIVVAAASYLLVLLLPKYRSYVFTVVIGLLVCVATTRALVLHEVGVQAANRQRSVVVKVVNQMPQISDVEVIVLLDDSNQLVSQVFPDSHRLAIPLRAIYDQPELRVFICHAQPTDNIFKERCNFNGDTVELYRERKRGKPPRTVDFPYSKAVLLRYTDGRMELMHELPDDYAPGIVARSYDAEARVCRDCQPSERLYTLFNVPDYR